MFTQLKSFIVHCPRKVVLRAVMEHQVVQSFFFDITIVHGADERFGFRQPGLDVRVIVLQSQVAVEHALAVVHGLADFAHDLIVEPGYFLRRVSFGHLRRQFAALDFVHGHGIVFIDTVMQDQVFFIDFQVMTKKLTEITSAIVAHLAC